MRKNLMSDYLYDAFDFTPEYRERLVEMLRQNTNVEMGGARLFDGNYNHAVQIPEELADFIIELKRHEKSKGPIKRMLEVGFAAGITNTILNKFFNFAEIVAIDTFNGPAYGPVLWSNLRFKNLTLVCGNSGSERAIGTANSLGPYDLIFIDGDHTYEGVSRDMASFAPMLADNGILAFHDIAAEWTGVPKAWREFAQSNEWTTSEFVCHAYKDPFGIGMASRK
jgi:predicted O-methyltransferase YrrM